MKKQIISFILVFLCAFNSKAATAPNDETANAVDLTAGFYHGWDEIGANAKVTPENVYGACVLNESTGLPYGNGNVPCLYYADLCNQRVRPFDYTHSCFLAANIRLYHHRSKYFLFFLFFILHFLHEEWF